MEWVRNAALAGVVLAPSAAPHEAHAAVTTVGGVDRCVPGDPPDEEPPPAPPA